MKNVFNFLKRNQVGILYGVGAGVITYLAYKLGRTDGARVVINNLSDGKLVWLDEITKDL